MAIGANYTTGFANGVTIKGVPLTVANPGKVFWVYNGTKLQTGQKGGSNGNKGTYDAPFSTLTYAITQCVANRGDIIFIKPGHAESVSSAGAIALSVAGVAIVGLGVGSSRPTFTLDTANTATITVTADDISVTNCLFVANFLSIATCFAVTKKNFTVQNCEFRDTSSILNFLNCINCTGAANTSNGLTVTDSSWFGLGTTSVNGMVLIADAHDRVVINRNRVTLARTADAGILLNVTTGASTNIEVGDNVVISKQSASSNGSMLVLSASSTGSVYRNYAGTLTTTSDKLFTTTVGVYPFENRVSGVVGATGFVIPAVDS